MFIVYANSLTNLTSIFFLFPFEKDYVFNFDLLLVYVKIICLSCNINAYYNEH